MISLNNKYAFKKLYFGLSFINGDCPFRVIKNTFFVFHPNLMKLREVLVQKVF